MILEYDLQFFAAEGMGGEKTEPATEKKLSDARKEGQVAKSREIANGLGLLTVFLVLKIWVGHMGYQFINVFSVIYERIPEVVTFWHGNMPQQDTAIAFRQMLLQAIIIMAPLLLLGLVVAFLSDVVQVGWKPTGKPLQPKFSKLNPLSGFKRIFSANALVELIKSILKIGLITYICYNYLKDKWPLLFSLYDMDLMQAIALIGGTVTDLGIRVSLVYMIISAADFIYQKYKFSKDMRMITRQLSRWYDVEFVYEAEEFRNHPFTGIVKRDQSLENVLKNIEETTNIKFEISERVIIIKRAENAANISRSGN